MGIEPRIILDGDRTEAARFVRFGLKCLASLKERMGLRERMGYEPLFQNQETIQIPGGGNVFVQAVGSLSRIKVFMPIVEEGAEEILELQYHPYLLYMIKVTYPDNGGEDYDYYISMYDLVNRRTATDYIHPTADPGDDPVDFPVAYDSLIWNDTRYYIVGKQDLFAVSANPETWDYVAVEYETGDWDGGNGSYRDGSTFMYYGETGPTAGEAGSWEAKSLVDHDVSAVGCCDRPINDCGNVVTDGVYDYESLYECEDVTMSFVLLAGQTPVGGDYGLTKNVIAESEYSYTKEGSVDVEIYGTCYDPYFPFEYDEFQGVETTWEVNRDGFENCDEGLTTWSFIAPLGTKTGGTEYHYEQAVRNYHGGLIVDPDTDTETVTTQWRYPEPGSQPGGVENINWEGSFYFDDDTSPMQSAAVSPLNAMLQVYHVHAYQIRIQAGTTEYIDDVDQGTTFSVDEYVNNPEVLSASINYDINLNTFTPYSQSRDTAFETFLQELIDYGRDDIPGTHDLVDVEIELGAYLGAQIMMKPDEEIVA